MTCHKISLILLLGAAHIGTAFGASVTANVTLPRGHIIERGDIEVSGNLNRSSQDVLAVYIGKEMRRTIYAGAKLNASHVDKPTLVRRNTRVNMVYRIGRLEMSAIGRALDEGGDGDIISVMNLESKRRVQGLIRPDGTIEVAK